MELLVDSLGQEIEIGLSGVAEIAQNVRTILTTVKKTVPLDRSFGLDASLIDTPTPVAQARLRSEIVQAINKYEPRATVLAVSFKEDHVGVMDGKLYPVVSLHIDEEKL